MKRQHRIFLSDKLTDFPPPPPSLLMIKSMIFFFFLLREIAENYDFYRRMINRFHNRFQLTNWQIPRFFYAINWRNSRFSPWMTEGIRDLFTIIDWRSPCFFFYREWLLNFAIFINKRSTNFVMHFNERQMKFFDAIFRRG